MSHLPRFKSVRKAPSIPASTTHEDTASRALSDDHHKLTKPHYSLGPPSWRLKRATRTRKLFSILSSSLFFVSVVFSVLVEIGCTYNMPVMRDTFFIRLDLSNVVPVSVPNAQLLNSIAQTLGLHDFYQVGLWNYCEGYNDQGVTSCTAPESLYWFDPVAIILSQLLAGASIALPAEIINILELIRLASNWMFGLFIAGACLSFVMIFLTPLAIFSRWLSLLVAMPTFAAALCTTVATIVGTVMFIIMRNVFVENSDVNIVPTIGIQMFAFMWVAAACTIFALLIQLSLICCCASRRDVKQGRKRGSEKAYATDSLEQGAITR